MKNVMVRTAAWAAKEQNIAKAYVLRRDVSSAALFGADFRELTAESSEGGNTMWKVHCNSPVKMGKTFQTATKTCWVPGETIARRPVDGIAMATRGIMYPIKTVHGMKLIDRAFALLVVNDYDASAAAREERTNQGPEVAIAVA